MSRTGLPLRGADAQGGADVVTVAFRLVDIVQKHGARSPYGIWMVSVPELMEVRDERRLLNLQRQLSRLNLLINDELGFVPLSRTGAELLFEIFSQRHERGSIMVTTNFAFRRVDRGPRLGTTDRSPAGPSHPPRPHPGNERRKLPPQAQQGNRRVPSSRRSRGRIGRTVNPVPSCSCNVSTLTDLLPSVITSAVHDHAAPVAQYLGAIDSG